MNLRKIEINIDFGNGNIYSIVADGYYHDKLDKEIIFAEEFDRMDSEIVAFRKKVKINSMTCVKTHGQPKKEGYYNVLAGSMIEIGEYYRPDVGWAFFSEGRITHYKYLGNDARKIAKEENR